jgi:TolA-binding protein
VAVGRLRSPEVTVKTAAICSLAAALGLGGCMTSGEGEKMRADLTKLSERVEGMERRDTEINEQVARLRKVLDQATALLGRNSADLGTKVAKNEADVAALTGQIEEAKHLLADLEKKIVADAGRIAALEQTQTKIVDRVAPTLPEDKESLWKEAQNRMSTGLRDDGRRFLRAFIQRFPQDQRSATAYLMIGQSFAAEGKHTPAAAEYQKVIETYPRSAEVPEAMYAMAESFSELKFCSDALGLLQDLTKRYPKSARTSEAKKKIRELQKNRRDKRLCTS